MAATRVTTVWTVILNALFTILSGLGITVPRRSRAAAPRPASASGLIPAQADAPALPPSPPRSCEPREHSLPPTIKQRIRAEAHGSSPSVRRISLLGGDWFGAAPADDGPPPRDHPVTTG